MLVTVTEEVISICSSIHGGINGHTAKLLRVPFPLVSGWRKAVLGTQVDVPDELLDSERREKLEDVQRYQAGKLNTKAPKPRLLWEGGCRMCDRIRGAGLLVTFDTASDELIITSLRSGRVTRLRGCDLND